MLGAMFGGSAGYESNSRNRGGASSSQHIFSGLADSDDDDDDEQEAFQREMICMNL